MNENDFIILFFSLIISFYIYLSTSDTCFFCYYYLLVLIFACAHLHFCDHDDQNVSFGGGGGGRETQLLSLLLSLNTFVRNYKEYNTVCMYIACFWIVVGLRMIIMMIIWMEVKIFSS